MRSTLPSLEQLHQHAQDQAPTHQGSPATDVGEHIAPGDAVEIWCRSLGTWSHGFVAMDTDPDGWRVVRRSDRSPLPVRFPDTDVRRAAGAHHRS